MVAIGVLAAGIAAAALSLGLLGPRLPSPAARAPLRELALTAGCATAGVLLASAVGLPLLGLAAAGIPFTWRRRGEARRRRLAEGSLVATLETIVTASRAGLVLADAIAVGVDAARADLAERLASVLARIRLGATPEDALALARVDASARVGAFLADLELCARSHLASHDVAAYLEDVLGWRRFERELASDLAARTAGMRFQVWLLAAVTPLLALYLSAMSPLLAAQLASPLGRTVLLPLGALFEIGGIVASHRVVARATK